MEANKTIFLEGESPTLSVLIDWPFMLIPYLLEWAPGALI